MACLLYITFLSSYISDTFSLNIGTIHATIYQTLNALRLITHCSNYRQEACQKSLLLFFQPFVALAVRCIEVDNLTDTYTLALTAYAMALYKPVSRFTEDLLLKLMDKAIITGKIHQL